MFAHINIVLCYYDIRCHNATESVTFHYHSSVGAAFWWWLSAAETCSSGFMSCIYILVCASWWSYELKEFRKLDIILFYTFCLLITFYIYRESQEECARLGESVPYVKVYRNNPKHLYPKLNGYGDNGQRSLKLWQLLHTYWLPNTY